MTALLSLDDFFTITDNSERESLLKVFKLIDPFCWRQWQFGFLLYMVLLPFYLVLSQFHTILSFHKVSFHGFKTFSFFFCDLFDWFLVILVCSSKASDVNDLMFADIQAHSLLDFSIIFPSLTWQIRTGMGWCGKQAKSLTISPSVCNHKYFLNVEHLDGVVCLSCQILEDGKRRDALSGVMHWHPHLFNIFMGVANNYESDEWTRPRHSTMI